MSAKDLVHFLRPIYFPLMNRKKASKGRKWLDRINEYRNYYVDDKSLQVLDARKRYIASYNLTEFCRAISSISNEPYRMQWNLDDDIIPIIIKEDYMFSYEKETLRNSSYRDYFVCSSYKELDKYTRDEKCRIIVSYDYSFPGIENMKNRVFRTEYFSVIGWIGNQYFDVFDSRPGEIVIDAGVFDGTTEKEIVQWGGSNISKIYAFELDPRNGEQCKKYYKENGLENVIFINKGIGEKNEEIFLEGGSEGSASSRQGKGSIKAFVTKIDDAVGDEPVSFIKMDIEGAEVGALKGASETIVKNKPRLAICVYHKDSDLYEIPKQILSLVPEYRFVLRHYTSCAWETVLYASVDGFQISL